MLPFSTLWTVSQHFMKIPVARPMGSSVGLVTVRAALQFTHDHAGDAVTQRGDGAWIGPRRPCRLRGGAEGEKASLAHEEAVRRQTQGDMVIEAAPAAALELRQADLLLEFTIVLLDPVAALDVPDEVLERRVGRQRTQPEALAASAS